MLYTVFMAQMVGYSLHDPCPYLPGREATMEIFQEAFDPERYERLLPFGFRRSGRYFYRYACAGCARCVPLRLSAAKLNLAGRYRRILQKNSDLDVRVLSPVPKEEYFLLYEKYSISRHTNPASPTTEEVMALFSYESSFVVEYRSAGGKLEGLGFLDMLPSGLSSVYFIIDPASSRRSLGYYSVLKEASLAMESGREWYYLGFWIPGSKKMDYKADFAPFQLANTTAGNWLNVAGREAALSLLEHGCA